MTYYAAKQDTILARLLLEAAWFDPLTAATVSEPLLVPAGRALKKQSALVIVGFTVILCPILHSAYWQQSIDNKLLESPISACDVRPRV